MARLRFLVFVFMAFIAVAKAEDSPWPAADAAAQAQAALIGSGIKLLQSSQPQMAMAVFDKAIAAYEQRFRDEKRKIYATRTQAETLLYMSLAATKKQSAVAVSGVWALGFYYKGYSLSELGNLAEAETHLDRALAMAPSNPMFLSERGNLYIREKKLQAGFDSYKAAADSAPAVSPPEIKNAELARAWRGMAYILVEQKKLDEAEKLYLQCLDLDKNDQIAARELKYTRDLKAK